MSVVIRHPVLGPALPDRGWVPAPRYLLRRDRVLRTMCRLPPGELLEIGCGSGALLNELTRMGHRCQAIETSPEARALAGIMLQDYPSVQVHPVAPASWKNHFDYVLALEVLEHIEDDRAALLRWANWLKPGGQLLISVPAHQRRWSASDVWAGHYRRYERAQLKGLLRACGFEPLQTECYGFPLANVIGPVRNWMYRQGSGSDARSTEASEDKASNTRRSGTERPVESRFYPLQASLLGTAIMRLNFALQSYFIETEMGTNYLILARRSPDARI